MYSSHSSRGSKSISNTNSTSPPFCIPVTSSSQDATCNINWPFIDQGSGSAFTYGLCKNFAEEPYYTSIDQIKYRPCMHNFE